MHGKVIVGNTFSVNCFATPNHTHTHLGCTQVSTYPCKPVFGILVEEEKQLWMGWSWMKNCQQGKIKTAFLSLRFTVQHSPPSPAHHKVAFDLTVLGLPYTQLGVTCNPPCPPSKKPPLRSGPNLSTCYSASQCSHLDWKSDLFPPEDQQWHDCTPVFIVSWSYANTHTHLPEDEKKASTVIKVCWRDLSFPLWRKQGPGKAIFLLTAPALAQEE